MIKATVVGCGLSGLTAAILLKERGFQVTIFEGRTHIGGNCYDSNISGTLVHNYGPHIFHTNDHDVFNFLSRYTEWMPFLNRPLGNTDLGLISLPYSKKTILQLGRELTREEIVRYIFRDYSEKQWGVPFEQIPASVTNRIPKTASCENPTWYEGEEFQCIPKNGYTRMMEKMMAGIHVELGCDEAAWRRQKADLIVYTGKIDQYFNYCFGHLPYRSLEFRHTFSSRKLPVAIINQNTASVPYTRIYDHRFFSAKHTGPTVITEEYSKTCSEEDIPFYPVRFGSGAENYGRYRALADAEKNVVFTGRLATFSYLDMWMAIKQSMVKIRTTIGSSEAVSRKGSEPKKAFLKRKNY